MVSSSSLSPIQKILENFRLKSLTQREKGTYFEELILVYLQNEASYRDLYSRVWLYADWAREQGLDARDTGIDLVAQTSGTNEIHAIQCKLYAEDYRIQKSDIDSFFTASGKKPFSHRIIVSTNLHWTEHAEDALRDQQPPVSKIDINDLENSQIEWDQYVSEQKTVLKEKKKLRPHQSSALNAVRAGLENADRGKLIMACGTGKTFTSLKIAEELAGKGKRVLFLVPSLSLLSQTLTEWTQESETPLHSFAVCSDGDVGKKRKKDDDKVQTFTHELRYPATTDAKHLAAQIKKRHDDLHMSVVFSTYHSIDTISKAQKEFDLEEFDLVICDEAHRTTGATFDDEDESNFVKIHDANYIHAQKRLYMTATPRIYGELAKASAEKDKVALCSMDNQQQYGKDLYVITFSEAVQRGLLCDYKVLVLAVEETHINRRLQDLLKDENNALKVDDAAKIIGCWKALSKQGVTEDLGEDADPMRRAVAFCQVIEKHENARTHKVSSKNIAGMFQAVVEAYQASEDNEEFDEEKNRAYALQCEAEHIDGGMNASEKEAKLAWLKADTPENTCRILSNVRCLSEGVDVPALDAVLFLTPRNSQVDVVQSVGRVMRNAPGKKRGYVILPVVIPAGVAPHEALDDNVTYKVVWQVLQALRSHDDRFDAMVNKMDLDLNKKILSKMEVIAVTDTIQKKQKKTENGTTNGQGGRGQFGIGASVPKKNPKENQMTLALEIGEIERAIYAKVVQKCGNRSHWEDWANDIAKIAKTHIDRIKAILEGPSNTRELEAFNAFAAELRDDLNDSITDEEIIEMLAQHLITKPVFDALFEGYSFTQNNPMSLAMQAVLDILEEHNIDKEADTLKSFYDSVKMRADGIENATGKQKIVVELYDKFFRKAFPKMTERLGIVYTPVEVVDFIIHSVNDVLKSEFGQTLGSEGVHIIDPFTGTGTFITRLLQSGLISTDQLSYKYKNEIHANEIVLLAYYIAAINIEAVYHTILEEATGEAQAYEPFEGICLTDTFQMYEKEDMIDALLVDNSARRKRQKGLDIRVIIGNPPYSIGQGSQNDNNQNVSYPGLDLRIEKTYVSRSKALLNRGLYDSYIRAIRWASDRIGESGVVGFVTGSGFMNRSSMDGLRKCLVEEFSQIYVFNLRGDIRKNMLSKGKAKEGQNIFGSGSMSGIALTVFVKNPNSKFIGNVFYHDIGDSLSKDQKLEIIKDYKSLRGVLSRDLWAEVKIDTHGDWLNQRDDSFTEYIVLGDKKSEGLKLFANFSLGVATNRDAWCYNNSLQKLQRNMSSLISFYNQEVARFDETNGSLDKKQKEQALDSFVDNDSTKISWSRGLKQELLKKKKYEYRQAALTKSLYRPFSMHWMYFDKIFNEMVLQMPRIFPNSEVKNLVICVGGVADDSGFSVLVSEYIPSLHTLRSCQCFPLYLYDTDETREGNDVQESLFAEKKPASKGRRDAITDDGLAHFKEAYPGQDISKEDIFYYVYGLLHSPEYRERYADNLSKELPRIPRVKKLDDFWSFSKAGRALAELHIGYENVSPYPLKIVTKGELRAEDYRVEKMKYGKAGKDKDLTTVHYNDKITLQGIPLEAYEYVVNGKAALDWVMERQAVRPDKDSGIVNDANDWANETMNNPKYPLDLFCRVVTVSLETMKIVKALPALGI